MRYPWVKKDAGWRAEMPDGVTLFAVPDRTKGVFGEKAARGASWRGGASRWDEPTSTLCRYGRDAFGDHVPCATSAKRLAEAVYEEARGA